MLRSCAAVLGFLVLGATSAQADTPAWCGASKLGATERTICRTPRLGDLDAALNAAWRATENVVSQESQQEWLATRNRCGTDKTCIANAYENRLAELQRARQAARGEDARSSNELQRALDHIWYNDLLADDVPAASANTPDIPPAMRSQLEAMTPRPWCDVSGLNRTERRICEDPTLSQLDALLALSYGQDRAERDDEEQADWLRSERDACGSDRLCIALAYSVRLHDLLGNDAPPDTVSRSDVRVPPGHRPPPGKCRVWYPNRPPGQQPPSSDCDVRVPPGAVLLGR